MRSLLAPFQGEVPPAPEWFERAIANAPQTRFIEVLGAQIELLTWGDVGKPGLLFLHGFNGQAWWWAFIAPFFAKHFRCAALSWSGMGRSSWRDSYSIDTFVVEARAAVTAAELDAGPVRPIVIAHSFGGLIAHSYAAAHPQDIGGAVLLDHGVRPPELAWRLAREHNPRIRAYPTLNEALGRFRFMPEQGCELPFIADFIARHSLVCRETDAGPGWIWSFDPDLRAKVSGYDGVPLMDSDCPIALIWGEDSKVMPQETLDYMRARFPAAPFFAIPAADHHLMVDQPLALVAGLRALLDTWPPAQAK